MNLKPLPVLGLGAAEEEEFEFLKVSQKAAPISAWCARSKQNFLRSFPKKSLFILFSAAGVSRSEYSAICFPRRGSVPFTLPCAADVSRAEYPSKFFAKVFLSGYPFARSSCAYFNALAKNKTQFFSTLPPCVWLLLRLSKS